LSWKPGWQKMLVSAKIVTFDASPHPGNPRHPWKREPSAGRASSRTTVPAGKNDPQAPEPLPLVMTQVIPDG
jgi:hypothetical protein